MRNNDTSAAIETALEWLSYRRDQPLNFEFGGNCDIISNSELIAILLALLDEVRNGTLD